MRTRQLQRYVVLVAMGGLLSVSAQFACDDSTGFEVCPLARGAFFASMDEIRANQIETFDDAVVRQGVRLSEIRRNELLRDGQLFGVLKLDRPIRHPNGTVEMPPGWLPEIPDGHPWAKPLTPADDAFYSWFEERIIGARLYDPANPTQVEWANAYLAKTVGGATFTGWTWAASSPDC